MELSPPDQLKLNVLLANTPQAVRIDESRMAVHALTAKGEMKVELQPTARDEIYLRWVRELFAGHVLDSPGGHPVFLRRWHRMGQAREENLDKLLLLGEPEAVVAVVHAAGLSEPLARRAWWAMPESPNARAMLANPAIAASELAPELAAFLVDYLPFEEEPAIIAETVRLVLQPGLVEDATRQLLWRKGRAKTAYYLGFLLALPDDLPTDAPAAPDGAARREIWRGLADNAVARTLSRVRAASGQAFLIGAERVLAKAPNQDIVNLLFECLAEYFVALRDPARAEASMDELPTLDGNEEAQAVLAADPAAEPLLAAMRLLAQLGYPVLRPIFSRTDAIGSLMRKKLLPVSEPVTRALIQLRQ